MKKIISLMLAIAMMLGCVSATADSSVFGFTTEQYANLFEQLTNAWNLGFAWDNEPNYDYGYPITRGQAINQDIDISVSIHDSYGISVIECDTIIANDKMTNENAIASGSYMGLVFSSAYLLLNPNTTEDAYVQASQEFQQLLSALDTADSSEGTIGGAKCVLKLNRSAYGMACVLLVMPAGSTLY